MDETKKERFAEAINNFSTIHIFMHDAPAPDPDSIGSAVGLAKLLKDTFQKKTIIHGVPPDHRMNTKMIADLEIVFIDPRDKESMKELANKDDHAFALVDCALLPNTPSSFNCRENLGGKSPIWTIDHHPHKDVVDGSNTDIQAVGSCSTIVTEYLQAFNVTFDPENKRDRNTATALMLGLMVDTDDLKGPDTDPRRDVDAFLYLRAHYEHDVFERIRKYDIPKYFNDALKATFKDENTEINDPYAILTPGFLKEERLGALSFVADYWIRVERINIVVAFTICGNEVVSSIRTKLGTKASDLVKPLFPSGWGGGKDFAAKGYAPINGMFDVSLLNDEGRQAMLYLTMQTLVERMKRFMDVDE